MVGGWRVPWTAKQVKTAYAPNSMHRLYALSNPHRVRRPKWRLFSNTRKSADLRPRQHQDTMAVKFRHIDRIARALNIKKRGLH